MSNREGREKSTGPGSDWLERKRDWLEREEVDQLTRERGYRLERRDTRTGVNWGDWLAEGDEGWSRLRRLTGFIDDERVKVTTWPILILQLWSKVKRHLFSAFAFRIESHLACASFNSPHLGSYKVQGLCLAPSCAFGNYGYITGCLCILALWSGIYWCLWYLSSDMLCSLNLSVWMKFFIFV